MSKIENSYQKITVVERPENNEESVKDIEHLSEEEKILLAKSTDSKEILFYLAKDSDPEVRMTVWNRIPGNSPLVLLLAQDSNPDVRKIIARRRNNVEWGWWDRVQQENYHIPESIRGSFLNDPSSEVRETLAANPDISEYIKQRLVKDSDLRVRTALAKALPSNHSLISILAKDKSPEVRSAIAEKSVLDMLNGKQSPKISLSILEDLSGDSDENVRFILAFNADISKSIAIKLSHDSDMYVRKRLLDGMSFYKPKYASEIFTSMLDDKTNMAIRYNIALRANQYPEIMAILANDLDSKIRFVVFQSPTTPKDIKEKLSQDIQILELQEKEKQDCIKRYKLLKEDIRELHNSGKNSMQKNGLYYDQEDLLKEIIERMKSLKLEDNLESEDR